MKAESFCLLYSSGWLETSPFFPHLCTGTTWSQEQERLSSAQATKPKPVLSASERLHGILGSLTTGKKQCSKSKLGSTSPTSFLRSLFCLWFSIKYDGCIITFHRCRSRVFTIELLFFTRSSLFTPTDLLLLLHLCLLYSQAFPYIFR